MAAPTIGHNYKFNLYNNPFISSEQYGRLSSICTHSLASKLLDVTQLHANMLPYLPDTVNPDAKQQSYYVIESDSADVAVICPAWLLKDPEIVQDITLTCVYQFKTPTEMNKYIELVNAYGFKRISMKTT